MYPGVVELVAQGCGTQSITKRASVSSGESHGMEDSLEKWLLLKHLPLWCQR